MKMAFSIKLCALISIFALMSLSEAENIDSTENELCVDGCGISSRSLSTLATSIPTAAAVSESASSVESSLGVVTATSEGNDGKVTLSTPDSFSSDTKDPVQMGFSNPKKSVSATTPIPTERTVPFLTRSIKENNKTNPFGDHCPCDLMANSCDLNCCCDVTDCTEREREAFTECSPLPAAMPDHRFCQQYKWVSTANHTIELEESNNQPGLLCIYRDNNPGRFALQDQKPIDSLREHNSLMEKRIVYKWSTPALNDLSFNMNSSYKAGDILWILKNSSFLPLEFLTGGFNSVCQNKKVIRFLKDWRTSCVLPIPCMKVEKKPQESSFDSGFEEKCLQLGVHPAHKDLVFLSSPLHRFNISSNVCPREICIHAKLRQCLDQNYDDCTEVKEIPSPHLKGNVCINVLLGVHLIVYVIGVNVYSAQVHFALSRIPFSGEIPAISRKYSVIFKWLDSEDALDLGNDLDKIIWKRSGNPGYIVGAPVMAGWKETVVLSEDDLKQREDGPENGVLEVIRVSPSPERWLTVLGAKAGSSTCGGARKAVRFGYSARWSCSISTSPSDFATDGCFTLKKKIFGLLFGWGTVGNLSERYIATFGDSSPEKLSEWIPLKIISADEKEISDLNPENLDALSDNKRKSCTGLLTSIELEFVTVMVGSVSNPQSKLVGAILRLGRAMEIEPHKLWARWHEAVRDTSDASVAEGRQAEAKVTPNENERPHNNEVHKKMVGYEEKYLNLVTSVRFVDVTGPAVLEVAPPPVYHIRLPYGFFHPFLSSAPSLTCPVLTLLMVVVFTVYHMSP